jgi:nucleoside-diphosphate-sugar epimerase
MSWKRSTGLWEGSAVTNPLAADLDHVLAYTSETWEALRGERLFLTGGTGFVGCWLLESFLWANDRLDLDAAVVVLTRDPDAFARKAPHLAAHPAVQLHAGDVRTFDYPGGSFKALIHAATDSSTSLGADDPLTMLDTIVRGTERALEFARRSGVEAFLLTSSGAVYGRQPAEVSHVPEDYTGAPDLADPRSAYGEGKRVAEYLCALYHRQHSLQTKIARAFAFIGPYLPLDAHFACGNFLRDGLRGQVIQIQGDGTPYRSYLYAADLAIWLWTILTRGQASRPYNVGCERAVSIGELAGTIAEHFSTDVRIAQPAVPGQIPQRYVPDVSRARAELGLKTWIGLDDAVARTTRWHRGKRTIRQPRPLAAGVA